MDANKKCVEASEMNAYAFDESKVVYIDEEVVYLGYLSNHWGHFLTDSSTRLYTFLEDTHKNRKYAYLVDEGSDGILIASVERFLELLGIRERIILISQVIR